MIDRQREKWRRFIPTPVGNILARWTVAVTGAVHPHTCGEHRVRGEVRHRANGSSPHLWGTSTAQNVSKMLNRFIPTPVGNIAPLPARTADITVHPHTCGEHHTSSSLRKRYAGSSPHLWGTCRTDQGRTSQPWFIPTPVGNMSVDHPTRGPIPVHPHTCGEHLLGTILMVRPGGSSPHLWGTSR